MHFALRFVVIFFGLPFATSHAAVNDILPGDYFPLPSGATAMSLYAYERDQVGPYRDGRKTFAGQLDSQVLALRAVRTFDWAGHRFAAVAVLPWMRADVTPLLLGRALGDHAQGAADLRLGLSGWLINDKENAHYLGLTGMLIAPTGDYDHRQVLNAGENRWRFVLMGGWQKDLTQQLLVELSPELAWYGENDDYVGNRRYEQAHSVALTGYLRWRVTPAWHVHIGAQANRGGNTHINGIDQRNPARNDRLMAGMTWFLPDQRQVLLRFGRDSSIENGFRMQREIVLRLQQTF